MLAVSAREGIGMAELKAEVVAPGLGQEVHDRARVEADVRAAAGRLEEESGTAKPRTLDRKRVAALEDAFADAAGVPTVVAAAEKSTRIRAQRATGWPAFKVFSMFRKDPLKRLHLDLGAAGQAPDRPGHGRRSPRPRRWSGPGSTPRCGRWPTTSPRACPGRGCRRSAAASVSRLDDLGDRLDGALASTDLGIARIPWWAGLVRVLQWLLILAALGGAAWLGALAVLSYLQMDSPEPPEVGSLPVPTLLLVGGVVLGLLLALGLPAAGPGDGPPPRRRRPTIACGPRSRTWPRSWSSRRSRPSSRPTRRCATGWSRRCADGWFRAGPARKPSTDDGCRRFSTARPGDSPARRRSRAGWSAITRSGQGEAS